MKVIVIGGGLLGLSSAYYLNQLGHDVSVLEREAGPGLQTSFANGSLLTPSMADPWNGPGSWKVLATSFFNARSPLKLRMAALPSLVGWGTAFLRNSSPHRYRRNTLANLHLALYSLHEMARLREATDIDYGSLRRGTLRIFREAGSFAAALESARMLSDRGVDVSELSRRDIVALEPALDPVSDQLVGGIHYSGDESGNAHRFCVELAELCRRRGVIFHFDSSVGAAHVRRGRVVAVETNRSELSADCYVIAAGSFSPSLCRTVGLELPVRPAKGYSVTFSDPPRAGRLSVPIVDDAVHIAAVPVEGAIRVAGTAEFAGFDARLHASRIDNLVGLLKTMLPAADFDPAAGKPWAGFRPMSADGVPIIGPTAVGNLYVNTGHGHLGWTMAAGSGALLADLVSRRAPQLDATAYSFQRFGGASLR